MFQCRSGLARKLLSLLEKGELVMLSRLMDLVVLVAELSQKRNKSFKELDKELGHLGYSAEEIEQALFWISSQWRPSGARLVDRVDRPAFRVLSPWEALSLDSDAYGYLLRLQNLGIIDSEQFEKILSRILPFGAEKLHVGDVKSVAASVLFPAGSDDEDELFNMFDEDIQVT
jgi:uncharacterized protein Smg (DUF494 family)